MTDNADKIRSANTLFLKDIDTILQNLLLTYVYNNTLFGILNLYTSLKKFKNHLGRECIEYNHTFSEVMVICAIIRNNKKFVNINPDDHILRIVDIINSIPDLGSTYVMKEDGIFEEDKSGKEIYQAMIKDGDKDILDYLKMWQEVAEPSLRYKNKTAVLNKICTTLDGDAKKYLEQIIGGKFFEFLNDSTIKEMRHSKDKKNKTVKEEDKRKATEEELQIMFDFGLTLVRFSKAKGLL